MKNFTQLFLLDLLADRIREHEDPVHSWPESSTPASRLIYMMSEYRLNQKELPEVGTQPEISTVLAAKRKLNLCQVKVLAERFHVSMEVFAG